MKIRPDLLYISWLVFLYFYFCVVPSLTARIVLSVAMKIL
jgi:hypothetical protein